MTPTEIAAGGYGALLVEKFDSNPEMPTIVYEANLAFEAGAKWAVEQAEELSFCYPGRNPIVQLCDLEKLIVEEEKWA